MSSGDIKVCISGTELRGVAVFVFPSDAGATVMDLCFAWGIGYSTFSCERGVLWPTIEALDLLLFMNYLKVLI